MDYVLYLLRALYRVKWWILLGTALITAIVYFRTGNLKGGYNVEATLYTGVVSGYGVEESTKVDWALAQNSMDNLINIIQAESTLKRVSLRLFSRILVKGSPDKDNEGITAASYNYTYNHMKNSPDGKALIALIDRTSEDKTMENFQKYERQDKNNYIYGLFYFQHVYYSYQALKNIKVERKGSSDLLKVSYQSGDPGIAYNTIEILMKEFVNEYQALRYEGTDKVIEYFKAELKRIGGDLTKYEDDLTQYNVENRIINYYDETKEIAAINKEFELREQNVLFEYNSSRAMLEELERQMDANSKRIIHNVELVDKLKQATNLTGKIIEMETISTAGDSTGMKLTEYKNRLIQSRRDLSTIANQYVAGQQTNEEVASRKKIVMMAAAGSFIFFVALFLLIEAIDRTLRDSTRTRKQTGSIVLGAYPAPLKLSPISKQCEEIATRYMSSAILRFFTERKEGMPFILNLLSTEQGSGKTYLAEQLQGYWESIGLKVRRLTDGTDFNSNSSAFTLAKNLTDLYTPGTEDILIVEYPSLEKANIPTPLLQDAQLNLLVASAVHGWKATDKVLLQKLKSQLGTSPYLYLNRAPKYEVETYTGMLPPYTFVHKQMYRLSQLALTESLFNWKKNSRKKPQDIDDDDDE